MSISNASAAELAAKIEGPQHPGPQGLDRLTLDELMAHCGVPGISVAVIRDFDFEIDWAEGYGVSDAGSSAQPA